MLKRHDLLAVALPAAVLISATVVLPRSSGAVPGYRTTPIDAARRAPSCGVCHNPNPGGNNVSTKMTIAKYSLDLNESADVTLNIAGGPAGTKGGFAAENTDGTFSATTGTQLNSSGRIGQFISHNLLGLVRSWTFPYNAPNTPGPIDLYGVGQAVNGDGVSIGDDWALNGSDPIATEGTPVSVYVNTGGVTHSGAGCDGSFGNRPVLGAKESPAIGNLNFALELVRAAPSAPVTFLIGPGQPVPIALDFIGITGCVLYVSPLAGIPATTSAGNPERAEGTATGPAPIPNIPSMQGGMVEAQAAIIDLQNGRALPITLTNSVTITFQ